MVHHLESCPPIPAPSDLQPTTSTSAAPNVEEVLKERGKVYGRFIDNAQVAEALETSLRSGASWPMLRPDQKQALKVMCQKMARIVTGNPVYLDNWVDLAGYAQLVVDETRLRAEKGVK